MYFFLHTRFTLYTRTGADALKLIIDGLMGFSNPSTTHQSRLAFRVAIRYLTRAFVINGPNLARLSRSIGGVGPYQVVKRK